MNFASYGKYRSSGVSWLGDIPAHWEMQRMKINVKNISDYVSDQSIGQLYIALEDIEGWTGKIRILNSEKQFDSQVKCFTEDDVLFCKLRPYLAKVARPGTNGVCVGEFLVLRPRQDKQDVSYLEQYLRSKPVIDAIDASTFGAKMPRADWFFIGNTMLLLPPLSEQKAIICYLGYMERRIRRYLEAKRKLVALLEEQKQAIIHHAITRGLNLATPLKDSCVEWLGKIPAHWEVKRLKVHLSRNDSGVWGDEFSNEGAIVLRSTEQTVSGKWKIISPAKIKLSTTEIKSALLKRGDLVITKSSGSSKHIGKSSLVDSKIEKAHCCFSNFMQRLRFDSAVVPTFIWYNLNSSVGREQLIFQSTTTTGLGNLNGTILGNCQFAFPSLSEQKAIIKYLDKATAKIDATISRTQQEIELLSEYRTRLIADVVTGKVDVRAVAAKLPEDPEVLDDEADDRLEDNHEVLVDEGLE